MKEVPSIKEMLVMIEAAFLSGYEPSADELTNEQMFKEASAYLISLA